MMNNISQNHGEITHLIKDLSSIGTRNVPSYFIGSALTGSCSREWTKPLAATPRYLTPPICIPWIFSLVYTALQTLITWLFCRVRQDSFILWRCVLVGCLLNVRSRCEVVRGVQQHLVRRSALLCQSLSTAIYATQSHNCLLLAWNMSSRFLCVREGQGIVFEDERCMSPRECCTTAISHDGSAAPLKFLFWNRGLELLAAGNALHYTWNVFDHNK